jgi:1-acyl-sn-glycerol-3-phosphate acyltransferase
MAPEQSTFNNTTKETGIATALLDLLRAFVIEVHPKRTLAERVDLDVSLDADLAIDSLSRVELLYRIERSFSVALPEQQYISANTPRELLRIILAATPGRPGGPAAEPAPLAPEETEAIPHGANTLIDVLTWHAGRQPDRTFIRFYQDAGENKEKEEISYGSLFETSRAFAAGLQRYGLDPGQTVALMLPTGRDYFHAFFGIMLAGGIPVPIYPPMRMSQIEEHLQRHVRILENAQTALLVTVAEAKPLTRLLRGSVEQLQDILTPEELLTRNTQGFTPVEIHSRDIGFIQYTSGSTGNPKGVVLTQSNLLANIRAMGEVTEVSAQDVFVSWLPLYHDMGLIGACLGSLYYAIPLILMSPLAFLARPQRWLWAIHHYRGTLSAAPNFAYELCLHKIGDAVIEGLGLSSWRMACNGAEPVSAKTVTAFYQRFKQYGFKRQVMAPVYGLAESTVGLAFTPPARGPVIERVRRDELTLSGRALIAREGDASALEVVSCGRPLPRHQIRIVDSMGIELPDRREGRLQFRGPSTTSGYFHNPEETRRLFDDHWLESGDLAYTADGEIFLTSRVKDLIIRAGRNIYPHELEEAVGGMEGIRKGCVAVFGSTNRRSQTERLVVLAETRETESTKRELLRQKITELANDILGTPPDDVVLAKPHTVLKTSSGKIRRAACKALYEEDKLGAPERPPWLQLTRLALGSLRPRSLRMWHLIADRLNGGYLWMVFLLLAAPVWLLVIILPRPAWRWKLMHGAVGMLLRLTGTPLTVHGLENIPSKGNYILAINHASYLDGIIPVRALPFPVKFIAKSELRSNTIARLFLERIGAEFVERFDLGKGAADTEHLKNIASSDDPLLFFPEGTFRRMPGLLPFRMGAFVTAVEAGIPVIPVTQRGTRSILRADSWLPRRGSLQVDIGQPIYPEGSGWSDAIRLRDRCREEILRHCGEPDLGGE